MKCVNCGKKCSKTDNKCPHCNDYTKIRTIENSKKHDKKVGIIASFSTLIAVVIGSVFLFLWIFGVFSSPEEPYYIGETLNSGWKVEYTVLNVDNSKRITIGGVLTYNTNDNFILIEIKVKNNKSEKFNLGTDYFKVCRYNEEGKVIAEYEASSQISSTAGGFFENVINPGLEKTYKLGFEVPTKTTEDRYALICYAQSGTGAVCKIRLMYRPEINE